MESFESKALDNFGLLTINKSFARKAGFGSRSIPVYVREWVVSHFVKDEVEIDDAAREKIADFVRKYVPDKSEREAVKNKLFEMRDVKLLDDFSVQVNLLKGDRYLIMPFLDESKGGIPPHIVHDNDMLLTSGIWGVGTLSYSPPLDKKPGQVIMREFMPFQLASLDLDYFINCRKQFTTSEWIDFIVNSMGFNHKIYNERQKIFLIARMLPMVEARYNLIELAPKGTGKSFVFENLSRYVAVRSGAVSAAVLFYNDARKTPGLITRYDCVVIDEAQKVRGDSKGELTALLKTYLESGRFGRGSVGSVSSEAGLVMLANIELDEQRKPIYENIGLLRNFPNFLRETAFLDRFSGLLPGWDLPRVSKNTPSNLIALKGDIFGEILHKLRGDIRYNDYVKTNIDLRNIDDMRDSRAVEAGASGFLKILFPDMDPSDDDFYKYCVNPSIELRQRVRDELCKMDREYTPLSMRSKMPDNFQLQHVPPQFVEYDPNLHEMGIVIEEEPISVEPIEELFEADLIESRQLEPIEKTIHIKEGDTGYSYESLFKDYLRGATEIRIIDPYIRLEFQIRNLISFISEIDTIYGHIDVYLTTACEDDYQQSVNQNKFKEMADNFAPYGINFSYEFSNTTHRRGLELNNGWKIVIDRGLDIFQKPESRYELSDIDQKKRRCRETEIIYLKAQ